jgi:CRISPR-associated protein Cas2
MELDTLVLYDIEDDKVRFRIAEDCKDAGLERVQMSAFRGPTTRTRRQELTAKLATRLGDGKGRILVVALCEKDARAVVELRNEGKLAPKPKNGEPEGSSVALEQVSGAVQ